MRGGHAAAAALLLAGCASAAPPAAPALPAPAPLAVAPPPAASVAVVPSPLERGRAHLGRGEMAAAATAFRAALRAEPELVDARAGLGQALAGLGDLDGAAEELRAALRRAPDAPALRLALARVLIARQQWPQAREELERAARGAPDSPDVDYALGVVRYAQGDVAGALEAYRGVLALDPAQGDARYNVALLLDLTHREAEAAPEFRAAAEAGHARAQYFLGNAYAGGRGVERDLTAAVTWWLRAAEQGVTPAEEALAQLREVALGRGRRPPAERDAAAHAFEAYRAALWMEFPDLTPGGDTVGGALLSQGRAREAVPVLIREAAALSEPAQRLLETLYEQGVAGQLAPHDPRILAALQSAAAEGRRFPAAR